MGSGYLRTAQHWTRAWHTHPVRDQTKYLTLYSRMVPVTTVRQGHGVAGMNGRAWVPESFTYKKNGQATFVLWVTAVC